MGNALLGISLLVYVAMLLTATRGEASQPGHQHEAHPSIEPAEIGGLDEHSNRDRDRVERFAPMVEPRDIEADVRIGGVDVLEEDVERECDAQLVCDQRAGDPVADRDPPPV